MKKEQNTRKTNKANKQKQEIVQFSRANQTCLRCALEWNWADSWKECGIRLEAEKT